MSSQHPNPPRSTSRRAASERRLVILAERREPVDLERFVAALVALTLRRLEDGDSAEPEATDD